MRSAWIDWDGSSSEVVFQPNSFCNRRSHSMWSGFGSCLCVDRRSYYSPAASLGAAWFLAALGVYIRDVGQITTVITTVLMFMSAVFYPISALPERYQAWLRLNPLVLIITESRKVLILGTLPDWRWLGLALLMGLVIAFAGFWWFQKTRKGFADVL